MKRRTRSMSGPVPAKDRDTFRVRGIPLDWNREQLQEFLAEYKKTNPIIESFSPEIDNAFITATVSFEDLAISAQSPQTESIALPQIPNTPLTRPGSLVLDKTFLGITTLYNPAREDHKVDVVALSGLGGHAFGSFKERGGHHMWLRDSLPQDLTLEETGQPMARVMIYGYESRVSESESMENIEDFATKFRESLSALASAPVMRPIILIAHSLGGLIVKEAIITLSRSTFKQDQRLLQAMYGIAFFGVPNDGMDITALRSMVGNGPNRFLIESIGSINSQILTIQQREFPVAFSDKDQTEVFCFYETRKSPTAQKKNGKWKMTGPAKFLVTKTSATHCRPWENGAEHICAVARTHSNLVKFGLHDDEYFNVRERLKGLARRSLAVQTRVIAGATFLVPYNKNSNFVGRHDILKTLKRRLGLERSHALAQSDHRVAVYGLGGIGKSQVALACVYWIQENFPHMSVFWVHASNAERFRQAYASIAEACKIPGREDSKLDLLLLVKTWLEKQDQSRWLMVIDNADDMELFFPSHHEVGSSSASMTATCIDQGLSRYIPECRHGLIIFTTRDKKTGSRLVQGKPPIEVDKMEMEEVYLLLHGILDNDELSREEMCTLASRLEYLPLALVQAAAFIQENEISLGDYVQLLDESVSALVNRLSEPFETVGRDSETPHAVTATWIISFKKIQSRNSLDSDVLSFLSFFHWQAIPKTFVEEYCRRVHLGNADHIETAIIVKTLGTLKAFSFISEDKHQNIHMHRLVQLVTRKWLQGRADTFARPALQILSDIYPRGSFETSSECLRLLPHAHAVLENCAASTKHERIAKARLLFNMAAYLDYRGEWIVAEKHLGEALNINRQEVGPCHPSTLVNIDSLAMIYLNQRRLDEAESLQIEVVEARKKKFGEDHRDTLASMNNLALTYGNQGRWEEAERLQVLVAEASKKKLGEDHLNTLTGIANLASTYHKQGRWEEAGRLQATVAEAYKKKLGEDHPDTLTSMHNLALRYTSQGRWEEAERLQMQVIEAQKKKLGEDHPDTLTSMNNLAATFNDQGRLEEAERLQIEVVEARKKKLGPDHPGTLIGMHNLALTYISQGQWEEAERLQIEVVEAMKKKLGPDHPDTLIGLVSLVGMYWELGRLDEANNLKKHCLPLLRAKLGSSHPKYLSIAEGLAALED